MNKFSADDVGKSIFHNMVSDFRVSQGHTFAANSINSFAAGVKSFRAYEWPKLGVLDVPRFKAWWQLRHLFKTHRFADDAYTDEELARRTDTSYEEFQSSVKPLDFNDPLVFRVVQEARRIAKVILGDFDVSAMIGYARFGKRSSIGCSYRNAYIDYKLLTPEAFTSTEQARRWFFKNYLPHDPVLQGIVKNLFRTAKQQRIGFNFVCTSLKLVNVPKSWKSLRSITPLSLIELFYTFAVGGMVQEKLAVAGLDLGTLQARHRELARLGSAGDIKIATTDLSRASDSIFSPLLCALLPRAWYCAIKPAFCRQVIVGGKTMATHTALPMGNGFTFPIETLVFYCLSKAIGNLTQTRGIYSVYGDDMIYPSRIHRYVLKVFPRLGLNVNAEKSFSSSFFRESCGGDYYRGCDVRPYIFKADVATMSRSQYLVCLYKAYNGLRKRWEVEELPSTFRWLTCEIVHYGGRVLQVPPSFPDYSGVRTERVEPGSWLVPFAQPKLSLKYRDKKMAEHDVTALGSFAYVFQHLSVTAKKRVVLSTVPYYWLAYRQLGNEDEDDYNSEEVRDPVLNALNAAATFRDLVKIDHTLKGYLKSVVHPSCTLSKLENKGILDYVRRKGSRVFDPVSAVRGECMVSSCSSVITFWA